MSGLCIQSIRVIAPTLAVAAVAVVDEVPQIQSLVILGTVSGSALQFTSLAAEALGSNCFVAINDDGELIRADASAGIAAQGFVRQAAAPGAVCAVITGGLANGFSGLIPGGTAFLGLSGQLTQSPPDNGLAQELGAAISLSKIYIEIQPPIAAAD